MFIAKLIMRLVLLNARPVEVPLDFFVIWKMFLQQDATHYVKKLREMIDVCQNLNTLLKKNVKTVYPVAYTVDLILIHQIVLMQNATFCVRTTILNVNQVNHKYAECVLLQGNFVI